MADFTAEGFAVEAFVGLHYDDVATLVRVAGSAAAAVYVAANTWADDDRTASTTAATKSGTLPPADGWTVVLMEADGLQLDYALNAVPTATWGCNAGVWGTNGTGPRVILDLMRRNAGAVRVRARVYARLTRVGVLPAVYAGDAAATGELVLAFEGSVSAVSRAGDRYAVDLTHKMGDMAASSGLSDAIAPGSARALNFRSSANVFVQNPALDPNGGAGLNPVAQTLMGALQAQFAASRAPAADVWGYLRKAGDDPAKTRQFGIAGFLRAITEQTRFGWEAVKSAGCQDTRTANDGGQGALDRIEPFFWAAAADSTAMAGLSEVAADKLFNLGDRGQGVWAARGEFYAGAGPNYYRAGYQYAVPIPFKLPPGVPGVNGFGVGLGLASYLRQETLESFGPSTLWTKLVNQYLPGLMLAFAPMADRGLVVPVTPTPDRVWRTVYAGEVRGTADRFNQPVPVRGMVLLGHPVNGAGLAPNAAGQDSALAVWDACVPGQFMFSRAPGWVLAYLTAAPLVGSGTAGRVRFDPRAPSGTSRIEKDLNRAMLVAAEKAKRSPTNLTQVPTWGVTVGTAVARHLWAVSQLGENMLTFDCQPRFDIGVGSALAVEIPDDMAAGGSGGFAVGVVTHVSLTLDAQAKTAGTRVRLGFVRSYAQAATPDGPLGGAGHPLWWSVWYGCPLADTFYARAKLGDRSTLD